MYGLIIKRGWLDLILSGKKILEIRGSDTSHQNEVIYLLESGSHRVRGTCVIESVHPISCSDWNEERNLHHVSISYGQLLQRCKKPYAWRLKDVTDFGKEEIYYDHPKGAVIWVKDVEKRIKGGKLK